MATIVITTLILAPRERCFDLLRSVDLHVAAAGDTGERIVGGMTAGLLGPGSEVTFEGRHFGVRQRLSVKITAFDRPRHFRDSQVKGIFARFDHDHFFEDQGEGTLMIDRVDFECPLGFVGKWVEPVVARHLRRFIARRNELVKLVAEGDEWKAFLAT